ncbi:MAG TPA: quinoprotein dehydrogenase-associated putative ABC transporter substrate-binding protein [Methylophilaceae bacterium]|nr:quinoprotein dehydrogenase-associated putative ABC transporter substrate-binding protein [Methylophilaceae bacterium]
MFGPMKRVSLAVILAAMSGSVFAAADIVVDGVDPTWGRNGQPKATTPSDVFAVCADMDNMPYSNRAQEGFENKIAELIAKDLGKKLKYQFSYDRQGFIRNTIKTGACDVIMGTTSDVDMLMTSKPIYRSGYVFVTRKDSGYNITDWDSPDLRKGIIGIVGQSPPTQPLHDHDLMANARPYRLQRDLNKPPSEMIDDLAKGDIDVAIIWGPLGGYYAKHSSVPMVVTPIPEYENINAKGKEYWNISLGVRHGDKARLAEIQEVLDRRHDDIMKILDEYGIPHVPVVEGDSIVKVYKQNVKKNVKAKSE